MRSVRRFELERNIAVTAGGGKNHRCLPPDGSSQSISNWSIASIQRHLNIWRLIIKGFGSNDGSRCETQPHQTGSLSTFCGTLHQFIAQCYPNGLYPVCGISL